MRSWTRGRRAAACVACAALLALCCARALALCCARALARPARAALLQRRAFPRRAPAALAHRLADFSTLPHAPAPGTWRVEEERGEPHSWSYRAAWECGARCAGEARVSAHAGASRHRVALHVRTCTAAAPLVPWSAACEELWVSAEVESDGADGAVLREEARAECGAGAGAEGDAACAARLRVLRAQHHEALALA